MAERVYRDLDLTFEISPITGDISRKSGVSAIKQSLKNIILYNVFEKPYSSHFNVGLRSLLFETKGTGFLTHLEKRIKTLISSYEPRVILDGVVVKNGRDANSITISIYYSPLETQTKETLELSLGKIR